MPSFVDSNNRPLFTIVNPYARSRSTINSSSGSHSATQNGNTNNTQQKNMGIQSQLRNGSIKACKKAATKAKHRRTHHSQADEMGNRLFVPILHCLLCRKRHAKENGAQISIPKRGHHKSCPNKPCNRGQTNQLKLSWSGQAAVPAENPVENGQNPTQNAPNPRFSLTMKTPPPPAQNDGKNKAIDLTVHQKKSPNLAIDPFYESCREEFEFAARLRVEVESRMELLKPGQDYEWATSKKAPANILLAIDYLLLSFAHRRPKTSSGVLPASEGFLSAFEIYNKIFGPNKITFTFPPDYSAKTKGPSPIYHPLEGETIMYLDWQLCCPNIELKCPCCVEQQGPTSNGRLQHDRHNFGKN